MDCPCFKVTAKGLRWFRRGHPWIFASDLASGREGFPPGVVELRGPTGEFLATALYSPRSQIALRILSRKKETIDEEWWRRKLQKALKKREGLEIPSDARRLVYAEGDGLPSLIVDRYGPFLVAQVLSAGLEVNKKMILGLLSELTQCRGILERSESAVRSKEGLLPVKQVVSGEVPREVIVEEGGLKFAVDLWEGQKTGAFLDQRSNRLLAGKKARGNILDVFSYEGWFACQMALRGERVLCVEGSAQACTRILENARRNGLEGKIAVERGDAFEFLKGADRAGRHFDTVNLDPPAFVKGKEGKTQGRSAYKEINLRAMKLLRPQGLLITSSCSYHFSFRDFQKMLKEAASDAHVILKGEETGRIAPDHPTHPHFPEGNYLKCGFFVVQEDLRQG